MRAASSDAGLRNTLRLLPSDEVDYDWAADALRIESSVGYVGIYIGLEGDITTGASSSNDWIYESWNVDSLWRNPLIEPDSPTLFVSFPSLKDPQHHPGDRQRHTCEIVALVDPDAFKAWELEDAPRRAARSGLPRGQGEDRAEPARAVRAPLSRLAPMVRYDVVTPVSVAIYTGAEHGAMYGLATTPSASRATRCGRTRPSAACSSRGRMRAVQA